MPSRKTSVLIVDDDVRILRMTQRILELEGYLVMRAISGEAAIDILSEENPDVVLLDIMMPDMDGYAVCRHIREFSQVPIIMVTAKGNDGEKVEGLNAGITPDGPRGPARKLQEGVITLGQLSQYPILPVSFSASRAIRLKSWDRFMIPIPFSRAAFVYGEPITIPRRLNETEKDAWRARVEDELNRVTDLSDELVGQPKL